MRANSAACGVILVAWYKGTQQFVFGMIMPVKKRPLTHFVTACLPSASPAGPRIYPTMQSALGLFWYLTSSCFRAIVGKCHIRLYCIDNFCVIDVWKLSCVDIERLFKMSVRQRSQTTRQVCHRLEEETNMTKIYLIHWFGGDFIINIVMIVFVCWNVMPVMACL